MKTKIIALLNLLAQTDTIKVTYIVNEENYVSYITDNTQLGELLGIMENASDIVSIEPFDNETF